MLTRDTELTTMDAGSSNELKRSILIFYKVVYWSAEKKTIICIDRQVIEDLDKQEGKSKYKRPLMTRIVNNEGPISNNIVVSSMSE